MSKTKIISFANHKGGVGKTTTVASVGSILAGMGKNVLLIDLDAQSNLTASLLKNEPETSIYTALIGKGGLPVVEVTDHLYLSPASLQLAMADLELSSAMAREKILSDLVNEVKDQYDYILIDCPPSLGLLTLNAFTASTDIIIPMVAEVLPFKGLTMITLSSVWSASDLTQQLTLQAFLSPDGRTTTSAKRLNQCSVKRLETSFSQPKSERTSALQKHLYQAKIL